MKKRRRRTERVEKRDVKGNGSANACEEKKRIE